MKKLIKADLSKVLELTAAYQPIDRDSLKAELEILEQSRYNDYLFMARKDRFRLMALSEVYTAGSDANGFLALFEVQTCWPVLALLLHVEYMESAPSGNPTLSKPRKYAGIGAALLAFGIQLSIDYGYGGAIYLKAKTSQLREHYMRNYGAIPFSRFDPFLLLIDGDAARELFGQYLKEV